MKTPQIPRAAWALVPAALVCGALLGYIIATKGIASSEAAAWLQALGSVGAIIGAIWIAQVAAHREERAGERARANSLATLADVAAHAAQTIRSAAQRYDATRGSFTASRDFGTDIAALRDAAAALESLSLTSIPARAGLVTSAMKLRRLLIEAIGSLDAMAVPDGGLRLRSAAEEAETCAAGIAAGAKHLSDQATMGS